MDSSFDSKKYIKHLGRELINNFNYSSSATTPVLVGTAREKEVARKLEMLLPTSIGIGSGCVIDSFGNTSKQMDIILYEKQYCPVFCINESKETTYYPCEGVIAVGEIKTQLDSKELENCFEKAKSVKQLQRYSVKNSNELLNEESYSYRLFGNSTSFATISTDDYDQKNKTTDQIYVFALFGNLIIKRETLQEKYIELLELYDNISPNILVGLEDILLLYMSSLTNSVVNSIIGADGFVITSIQKNNFEFLLQKLREVINSARTVRIDAYDRYMTVHEQIDLTDSIIQNL